jgi:hypothetical protein
MTRTIRTLLIAVALFATPLATASTKTTDITDMWWIPTESGWGVNVILQYDVAFLTFFVYDDTRNPFWVVAIANFAGPSGPDLVWSGDLYATTGPWFGGPFNPSAVVSRKAGTATFRLKSINQAELSYTVDGVVVNKVVQRQTWKNENYSGSYSGGYSFLNTGCTPAALNGVQEDVGVIDVNHTGATLNAAFVGTSSSCTFTGNYNQTGKLGEVTGTYNCADGTAGTFDYVEMNGTISGFSGRMSGRSQFCQWTGTFGGVVRSQ